MAKFPSRSPIFAYFELGVTGGSNWIWRLVKTEVYGFVSFYQWWPTSINLGTPASVPFLLVYFWRIIQRLCLWLSCGTSEFRNRIHVDSLDPHMWNPKSKFRFFSSKCHHTSQVIESYHMREAQTIPRGEMTYQAHSIILLEDGSSHPKIIIIYWELHIYIRGGWHDLEGLRKVLSRGCICISSIKPHIMVTQNGCCAITLGH